MKRAILTLLLALTLATTMLLGGLTHAAPASANNYQVSASQCNYINYWCHLQASGSGTGTYYITWVKYWNSCQCYEYDYQQRYVVGGNYFYSDTWVRGDESVSYVTIQAPGYSSVNSFSIGPKWWYQA